LLAIVSDCWRLSQTAGDYLRLLAIVSRLLAAAVAGIAFGFGDLEDAFSKGWRLVGLLLKFKQAGRRASC
jgi:hypothetical protein